MRHSRLALLLGPSLLLLAACGDGGGGGGTTEPERVRPLASGPSSGATAASSETFKSRIVVAGPIQPGLGTTLEIR